MKDLYAILGVIPSAEDIVIRAAWKALSQRYHPDRYDVGTSEVNAKMVEINNAYAILSDKEKRKSYDESRNGISNSFNDWIHEENAAAKSCIDPLKTNWDFAVGYYPDLVEINNRLSQVSTLLAFTFRASMLDRKLFEQRHEFAEITEKAFMEVYFGTNYQIVEFARQLIFGGHKDAAKVLNQTISILGKDAPPDIVISKITADFKLPTRGRAFSIDENLARHSLNKKKKGFFGLG
jgi:curved DNA-binding protein CbpA